MFVNCLCRVSRMQNAECTDPARQNITLLWMRQERPDNPAAGRAPGGRWSPHQRPTLSADCSYRQTIQNGHGVFNMLTEIPERRRWASRESVKIQFKTAIPQSWHYHRPPWSECGRESGRGWHGRITSQSLPWFMTVRHLSCQGSLSGDIEEYIDEHWWLSSNQDWRWKLKHKQIVGIPVVLFRGCGFFLHTHIGKKIINCRCALTCF